MSENESRRVVLLAREGQARDKLRQTLRDVGADVVLEADPSEIDAGRLKSAAPQVVLVALDAAVEDSLPRLGDTLQDPGIRVIFDDAELAAQRSGWDAQRWARHLSAKLHGHDDVLPPGREIDEVAELRPGRPATPAQVHADARFEPHLREARDSAPALPQAQDGLAGKPGIDGLSLAEEDGPLPVGDDEIPFPPVDAAEPGLVLDETGDADAGAAFQADEPDAWQPPTRALDDELNDGFGARFEEAAPPPRPVVAEPPPLPPPLPPEIPPRPAFGGLRLELEAIGDETADAAAGAPQQRVQGAALLFAGIGGPDAVRRVLAELPASFPRPVLLHLRLDGGRYDNLVKQLERVSPMPVVLARAGIVPQRARVYVVPNDVEAAVENGSVRFGAGATDARMLIAALPPAQSSVLLLSGSDPACVDAALALAAKGGYVAGQSLQGCYDPAASKALQIRGGVIGSPSDLAAGLVQHG